MILISVKSEIYNDKRQFETDKKAFDYLVLISKIHELSRLQKVGKKPKLKDYKTGKRSTNKSRLTADLKRWRGELKVSIPLRIEIINTNNNQLSLL
jgi:hypothetical protein